MPAPHRHSVGEKFLHEVAGPCFTPSRQPRQQRPLGLQVNRQTALPFGIEQVVVPFGRFVFLHQLIIVGNGRQPQTIGMKKPILVVLLAGVKLCFGRMVTRPDAGPLQRHDIFRPHRNHVRRQPAGSMLHHRTDDQLIAAAAIKFPLDEGISSREAFDIGSDQIGSGNGIVDKCALTFARPPPSALGAAPVAAC